ncbi:MAG: hypothetical protein V4663_09680 [Bacteroidota bacterium]
MDIHSVQGENSIFFQQLDVCCKKVALKVGDKDIAEWKNSDYVRLSGLLHRQTKVNLSENTLKRIFGKLKTSTRYYPQKATRDALAQFIGFRDWHEFELLHPISKEKNSVRETENIKELTKRNTDKKKSHTTIYISSTIFLLTLIIGFAYFYKNDRLITNVKLVCLNPNGQSPHSAIFKLAVKGNLPDDLSNFNIDFADSKLKKLNFKDSLVNHYYETPGRYFPVLYHKNTIIDTVSVYLQSKGWSMTATMQHDTTRVYPISRNIDIEQQNHLISPKELLDAGVDTNKTFFVAFANVKPTTINADNFELSGDFKTSASRPGVRCSQVDIVIYGENDWHNLSLIKPECVAWSFFKFSEIGKDGDKNDLRTLGHDLTNGASLKLRIENKHVKLYIEGKEVFKTSYQKPIGKLMGVKFMFAGIGSFQNFQLSDLKTGEKF